MMNLLHSTWFWVIVIASPVVTVVGILVRLLHPDPVATPPDGHKPPERRESDGTEPRVPPSE